MLTGGHGSSLVAVRGSHRCRGLAALAPLIAVAALLLVPAMASATTGTIEGTVTNVANGDPIAGIEFCALRDLSEAHKIGVNCEVTNSEGEYTLSGLFGAYILEFSGPNYLTYEAGERQVEGTEVLNVAMQELADNASSKISVNPNPSLYIDGEASFTAIVTVRNAKNEAMAGDTVQLGVNDLTSASRVGSESRLEDFYHSSQITDSNGQATFSVTCPVSECLAEDRLEVAATDAGDLSLQENEEVGPGLVNGASGTSLTPDGTATAAAPGDPLWAEASGGEGNVTVGQYAADPVQPLPSGTEYIDVFVSKENSFTDLTFTDCDLNNGTTIDVWNPQTGAWEGVSSQTAPFGSPPSGPCITVTINKNTTPKLSELTGTVFGVTSVSSTPPSFTGSGGGSSTPPASSTTSATTVATGSVSLDGSSIAVQSSGATAIKLTCTGTAICSGELTLTAKSTTKKGKKKKTKTETIGTADFSIPAGSTATITSTLNSAGKALLKAAHGHLSASLTILKSSPSPTQTNTDSVHLAQQKATKAKKGKEVRH
jgi:hypothetical protein